MSKPKKNISKKVNYVLTKPLRKKGIVGDVIKVAKGFGRYLESEKIAERATSEILKNLDANKKQWQAKEAENEKNAIDLIAKLKDMKIHLSRKVSQADNLYESVRVEHIVVAFREKGIQLQNNNIKIHNQIKKTGNHHIIVHVYGNYEADIAVEVVATDI